MSNLTKLVKAKFKSTAKSGASITVEFTTTSPDSELEKEAFSYLSDVLTECSGEGWYQIHSHDSQSGGADYYELTSIEKE
ncbi:hypothetical protein LIS04_181 [Listeria phage LIS04]|nr:hypothetical protein LIS04_181 [Listeria phage LIS04]